MLYYILIKKFMNNKNVKYILADIFVLIILSLFSCKESINEPEYTAHLDIIIATNDSVQFKYDDEVLIHKKLTYTGIFGYSWWIRINPAKVGIHKFSFTVFSDSIKAERRFYIVDTMTVYISNFMQNDKFIRFSTVNRPWYGE